jgi:nitrite reductase/ring-hydroxylating ferredoxin subunit/uncharacterized membrane protein
MRSRAHFRSHPLHPMLIPFPLAFLVGGFAADLGAAVLGIDDLWVVGWYLIPVGVLMGVVAGVPGLIDYLFTVPPDSSAKTRATRHLLVNVTALAVFSAAWILRGGPGVPLEGVLIFLEGAGVALLVAGGWMGGTLVYRNQIGVDHRYSRAGKWSESRVDEASGEWLTVARDDELEVDQMKLVHVGDRRIVVARTESGWTAFSDHCTHKGGSLAGGVMACGVVVCPWHGSQFDATSGKVEAGPAEKDIPTYPIEVRDGEVRLRAGE